MLYYYRYATFKRTLSQKRQSKIKTPTKSCHSSIPSQSNWVNVTDSSIFEVTTQPVETITLCKISNEASSSKTPAVITHTLVFQSDRTWQVRVHNHGVDPKRCSLLQSFPSVILSLAGLQDLLLVLDNASVCCGHPESHFVSMIEGKKNKIISAQGEIKAQLDDYASITLNGDTFNKTVRTTSCEIICDAQICTPCKSYRAALRAVYHSSIKRATLKSTVIQNHTNKRYLRTPEKKKDV